jgi:hypothetical protein
MKYELIRTEKYILAVNGRGSRIGKYHIFIDNCNREIYAHLPLNGSPVLEGVPVLPPITKTRDLSYEERVKWFLTHYYETGMEYEILLETMKNIDLDNFRHYNEIVSIPRYVEVNNDVDDMAREFYWKRNPDKDFAENSRPDMVVGFVAGYDKCHEKYNYTEEDLIRAWTAGRAFWGMEFSFENWLENYKKTNQQPEQPIAFECETCHSVIGKGSNIRIKTITNSEGRTEWVGKYIYE